MHTRSWYSSQGDIPSPRVLSDGKGGILNTPLSRNFHSKKRSRKVAAEKEMNIVFSSPESFMISPKAKMPNLGCIMDENGNTPSPLFSVDFDHFEEQSWNLEEALRYIESPQKPLSDREFYLYRRALVIPRESRSPEKISSEKRISVVSPTSPDLVRALEESAAAHKIEDYPDFPLETNPYILQRRNDYKNLVVQAPLLSGQYVENSISSLLNARKLNECWLRDQGLKHWVRELPNSPMKERVSGRQLQKEILTRWRTKNLADGNQLSEDKNRCKPICLDVKYGSSNFTLLLTGCELWSNKFYKVVPRIFSLWKGRVHGINEQLGCIRRPVPRCFYPFALDANMLLTNKKNRNVLEVVFCYMDRSVFLAVDETTLVGDIQTFCEHYFALSCAGSLDCIQLFTSNVLLQFSETYGSVVAKHGISNWWFFYSHKYYDQDITLFDLKDEKDIQKFPIDDDLPELEEDWATVLADWDEIRSADV